jgi:phosphate butyryltransferase
MTLPGFEDLHHWCDTCRPAVPVVAAGGADLTVVQALSIAAQRGWVKPILTGTPSAIEAMAASAGVDLAAFRVIDSEQPAVAAVAEIRAGRAAALMKGQIPTPNLMKAVLDRASGLRTDRVIGQVVLMEILKDQRRFLLTDTGITIRPTLEQKQDLLHSLLDVTRRLREIPAAQPGHPSAEPLAVAGAVAGQERNSDRGAFAEAHAAPRVAVMAASEKVSESMPETVDAARLQSLAAEGAFGDAVVEGPLSFDLAYEATAGLRKGLHVSVMGAAEAMLFPDLLSANLTVKAMMYTADCRFGGLLVGTAAPVVFMSRADSVETRLNSLSFTLSACSDRWPVR